MIRNNNHYKPLVEYGRMVHVKLTGEDLEDITLHKRAEEIWGKELIRPLNGENLFVAAIYALLSARENVPHLNFMMNELKRNGIITPQDIRQQEEAVKLIVPGDKARFMKKMSNWWEQKNLSKRIIEDYNGPRINAVNFREEFKEGRTGLGNKCSSLFLRMVGYEDIAPIDIWAIRYLRDKGYNVFNPDKNDMSGATKRRAPKPMPFQRKFGFFEKTKSMRRYYQTAPTDNEYRKYESWLAKEGRNYGFSVAKFQCLLWAKYSTWKLGKPDEKQIKLF